MDDGFEAAAARAGVLLAERRFGEAAELLQETTRAYPIAASAWLNLGYCLARQSKFAQAEAAQRTGVALAPGCQPWLMLAETLCLAGKISAAVVAVQEAIEADEHDWRAWAMLSDAVLQEGRPAAALNAAKTAQRCDPTQALPFLKEGAVQLQRRCYGAAERAFRRATRDERTASVACHNLAICRFAVADLPRALRLQRRALRTLAAAPSPVKSAAPESLDERDAVTAILRTRELFARCGHPFFLVAGTLLGFIRDGGFLAHDKDIDVGMDCSVPVDDVLEAARTLENIRVLPGDTELRIRLQVGNVGIDVFRYFREDGRVWAGAREGGQLIRWWFTPFEIAEIERYGVRFSIPADPDRYLTEAYGDWRVPDPHFDPVLSSPNRDPAAASARLYLGLNHLYLLIADGRYEAALALLGQLSLRAAEQKELKACLLARRQRA